MEAPVDLEEPHVPRAARPFPHVGRPASVLPVLAVGLALTLASCATPGGDPEPTPAPAPSPSSAPDPPSPATPGTAYDGPTTAPPTEPPTSGRPVTLAFAGDVHFQLGVAALLDDPQGAFGPIARTLRRADVAMVNLETAITTGGTPDAKELEVPDQRYHFRAPPAALDVLAGAGVDVATMANNHGADYGPVGLSDTLRAAEDGPVAVIGVGRDRAEAFAPHVVSVRGTDVAFLAGDASPREGASDVWAAGPDTPGLAAAHGARPRALLAAVRAADSTADVVVVYMHWGEESTSCPTEQQRSLARQLTDAGADVIVGSHAHVLQGSGYLDDTYVGYGLGNFVWYHDRQSESGVLTVRVQDGRVVSDTWTPGRIIGSGAPVPLRGRERDAAREAREQLRSCTGLAPYRPARWTSRATGPWTTTRPPYAPSGRLCALACRPATGRAARFRWPTSAICRCATPASTASPTPGSWS